MSSVTYRCCLRLFRFKAKRTVFDGAANHWNGIRLVSVTGKGSRHSWLFESSFCLDGPKHSQLRFRPHWLGDVAHAGADRRDLALCQHVKIPCLEDFSLKQILAQPGHFVLV